MAHFKLKQISKHWGQPVCLIGYTWFGCDICSGDIDLVFLAINNSTFRWSLVVMTVIELPLATASLAASSCMILPSGLKTIGDWV